MLAAIYSTWLWAKLIFHKIDMQWTVSQLNPNGTNVYLNVGKFYCAQTSKTQHKPKSQTTGAWHDLWTIFCRNAPFAQSPHVLKEPTHPFLGTSTTFSPTHQLHNVAGMASWTIHTKWPLHGPREFAAWGNSFKVCNPLSFSLFLEGRFTIRKRGCNHDWAKMR